MLQFLSFLWSFIPQQLAMGVWRFFSSGELATVRSEPADFPALSKDSPWGYAEAMVYHRLARGRISMSQEDEKLIRFLEIRKGGFFKGIPSVPAAILASALADMGSRLGDLRATNTALKLRDLAVASLPPLTVDARAHFHDADKTLESTLQQLRSPVV